MSRSSTAEELIRDGTEAYRRRAWREAFELLSQADAAEQLAAEDLERLGGAAWWTGRLQDCIDAYERAFAGHMGRGERGAAGRVAVELANNYSHRLSHAVAAGWVSQADRLLREERDSRDYAWLLRMHANRSLESGEFDTALEWAGQMLDLANRLGDRDLQALAIHERGRALVAKGEVDRGMALLDEAAAAAVGGELGPYATGIIYCNVIGACRSLADYRRAGDWTEVAKRWCERQAITGFPGVCRVYRAEIMRLRGAWAEANDEALRACDELTPFTLVVAAAAFAELGEVRLRVGDLEGAEEAFHQANEMGHEPQPGLALLRLAQGRAEAGASMINRAVSEQTRDRLARARLLPAQVEIALAVGDQETARAAVEEIAAIAKDYGSAAMHAAAVCADGSVRLADGDASSAAQRLRQGWRLWQELDCPYEAAKARVDLGMAYRAEGDDEAALPELRAARSAFDRLGAGPDARRAAELLQEGEAGPRAAVPRVVRTFMFTDICKSTDLVEAIGDEAWEDLQRWHDQALRSLFVEHGGEEVKHGGDGFFVAFPTVGTAVECAVAIQRRLVEHRRSQGFAPQVRIGLHAAEATQRGADYGGKGVHQAARIAALADAGEILASRDVVDAGEAPFPLSGERTVNLKGISSPVSVVSVEWRR